MDPPFRASVLATDSSRDIALLRFDPTTAQLHDQAAPLSLGIASPVQAAQPLMAPGYSGTRVKEDGTVGSAVAKVGVLSQIIRLGSKGLNLRMDTPIDPGDSGGPVLNADGFVVGMTRAAKEETDSGQREPRGSASGCVISSPHFRLIAKNPITSSTCVSPDGRVNAAPSGATRLPALRRR